MFKKYFKRLFIGFAMDDTLMKLRLATKAWKRVADAFIDEGVESGAIIVHDGKDISYEVGQARGERRKLVTRVIFLLNVIQAGNSACAMAINLVVVEIPEGVESIGDLAFLRCRSLTTVSFPTTLKIIVGTAFYDYSSL
ncbi:hypothetical protein TL16_g11789 [Triparma laevis f. inornata]|uniref:Uncharacterized protein n=1 Tax=Triparma laevis f. inornata TaxID=1714386 RepID=A0A9W7BPU7_9STRA|nr:hypothetical protein TL16_g11789 [Triparma laevis f. inornata]